MNAPTDWTSAIAILAAGLIVGAMIIYLSSRRKTTPAPLEAQRDALLEKIRGLAEGDERRRLELEAAHVLRQIDRGRSATSLRFVWVAVALAIFGALAFYVSKSSNPKEPSEQAGAVAAAVDSTLDSLRASVRANPEDLEARVRLARAYVERNDMRGVAEQTEYVLTKNPNDGRALTYHALALMSTGDNATAMEMLQKAIVINPDFLDAYVTTAWLQLQTGRATDAEKTMLAALKLHPDQSARLQPVFDEIRRHKNAPARNAIRVALEVASKSAGTVWVIARPAGVETGHPVAVKRVDASSLPTTIDLGDGDSMTGEPLPDLMRVEARLDSDGDVITKSPTDPFAAQDKVAPGSSIKLSLK
jgi:cytochrome c-type biogenesis protein CcmH